MRNFIWTTAALVCLFSLYNVVESRHVVVKREGNDDSIDPNFQEVDEDDSYRDKRKVDDVKFGVKNAVLGFVFNKINSFLDQKTHWVDQLDRTNIAKNKAAGIEPPKDPIVSLSGIISGPKNLRFAWDTTTTTKRPTTTEDIVIFEKNQPVSLDIPDRLFGSSFSLVTNLSTTVGDFMINSALRAQRLLESMRPFLQKVFGAKGIVIEAHTDKPIFSAPDS